MNPERTVECVILTQLSFTVGETVESVAKGPHIKKYIAFVTGKSKDFSSLSAQSQNGSQRKKPIGNKSKKEYLKWKRERSRVRRQNESDDETEIKAVQTTGLYGSGELLEYDIIIIKRLKEYKMIIDH